MTDDTQREPGDDRDEGPPPAPASKSGADAPEGASADRPRCYRDLKIRQADGHAVDEALATVYRREEEILRARLAHPRAFQECGVQAPLFEAPDYRIAWSAMDAASAVHVGDGPLHPENVVVEMRRIDTRFDAGAGSLWMAAIRHQAAVDVGYALEILVPELIQRSTMRSWHSAFQDLGGRIDRDPDTLGLYQEYLTQGYAVALTPDGGRLGQTMEEIAVSADTAQGYVATGIPQIDNAAGGGLGFGDVMAVGGGTNSGKSYLAQRLHRNQARQNMPSVYISVEDPKELMLCRMLADYSSPRTSPIAFRRYRESVRTRLFVPGACTQETYENALGALSHEQQKRVFLFEAKKWKVTQICGLLRRHRYMAGCRLACIDYLQAIQPDEPGHNRTQEVAEIMAKLKKTAGDIGMALVIFSQYSREEYKDGAEPSINAFKYAGDIENESEVVVLLWRDQDDRLHCKVPKVKWAKAQALRYFIPTDPDTGNFYDWEEDFSTKEQRLPGEKKKNGARTP